MKGFQQGKPGGIHCKGPAAGLWKAVVYGLQPHLLINSYHCSRCEYNPYCFPHLQLWFLWFDLQHFKKKQKTKNPGFNQHSISSIPYKVALTIWFLKNHTVMYIWNQIYKNLIDWNPENDKYYNEHWTSIATLSNKATSSNTWLFKIK